MEAIKLFDKKVCSVINFYGLSLYALLMPIMQNPYKPFLGNDLIISKIQIVDILFLLISPFLILEFFRERKNILNKYKLQLFAISIYIFSIFISIRDFNSIDALLQLFTAIYLSALLISLLVVIKSREKLFFIGKSIIAGSLINLLLSIIALIIFYFFNHSWSYTIQENKVFPYLGEVVRLTGTFKPTAKLLSSYLTLLIPGFLALSIIKKDIYRYFFLIITILSLIIFPFTLSRGVVGLLFALTFLFNFLKNKGFIENVIFKLFASAFALFFIITSLLSTIHISNVSTKYSYDGYSDHPSTVYYFYDPNKGMEKFSSEIEFARDHYFWLKKASLLLIRDNPLGVGVGNFSKSLKLLEKDELIPQGLSRHPTPQSEVLFAASERGLFGAICLIFLFISWINPLYKKRKDIIIYAFTGSLIALCFVDSIYLEITKFRFLWFLVGVILIYAKDFSKGLKDEISSKN